MGDLQKEFIETVPGVYSVIRPANAVPIVFDSPHSGTEYPHDFGFSCNFKALEKAEDKYVDELFGSAPHHGAALLSAHFPRSYIDVNRCKKDIDPELLAGEWPGDIDVAGRSHAGIGLIRRLVRPGMLLYSRMLSVEETRQRIEKYYDPYHAALKSLIDQAHYDYGQVWHINCHSMPSLETSSGRPTPQKPADFVLGDRDGTTCDPAFTRAVRDFLMGLGYYVAINDPYKGVELVKRYSKPLQGRHSLQIEIARNLYLNEDTYEKLPEFGQFKTNIDALIIFCMDYIRSQFYQIAAD